jgi:hypothetical protein
VLQLVREAASACLITDIAFLYWHLRCLRLINGERVREHAPICGTDKGMKPPNNVLALDSLHPVIRLTLATMLTKGTCARNVVKYDRWKRLIHLDQKVKWLILALLTG